MTRISAFLLCILLVGGCTKTEEIRPEGEPMPVTFNLGTDLNIDPSIELRPVTRASQIVAKLDNAYRVVILKNIDSRWILHRVETGKLTASTQWTLEVSEDFVPNPYRTELTPGRYRIVVILNPRGGKWNNDLRPGDIVADENDPQKVVPAILTYWIQTEQRYVNYNERYLSGEIFVGTADFTVSKSETVGQLPDRQVSVPCKRHVARFRILLKDKENNGLNNAIGTENFVRTLFTAKEGKVFCDGINAMGRPYYDKTKPTQSMRVNVTCSSKAHSSEKNQQDYQMVDSHSNVPSFFWFTDPGVDVPFDLKLDKITERSQTPAYIRICNGTFPLILKNNAVTGIVFEADGTANEINGDWYLGLQRSYGSDGQPEDPADLFDPFYEWNTEI